MATPFKTEKWGEIIDIEDDKQLTEPIINGYILQTIKGYKFGRYKDIGLWEVF